MITNAQSRSQKKCKQTTIGHTNTQREAQRTSGVLGVHIIGNRGGALASTLLLRELSLLGVGVDLLGILGVLGGNGVGNLSGLLTSSLQIAKSDR